MKSYINNVTNLALFLLLLVALEAAVLFTLFIHIETTKVAKKTCGDFTTYQEALQAFNAGNTGLDHNKNGVPCQTLL